MKMDIDTPQFSLPFRLAADGQPVEVEQDSLDEVADCVETLIRTPIGFLEEEPDYGVTDPTFEDGDLDVDEVQSAIAQWEERADVFIEEDPGLLNNLVRRVAVNLRARTTDELH